MTKGARNSPFAIYGLTGGIASGKSAVAGFLRELGVEVIDADAIARELRAPGGAAEVPIRNAFGTLDPKELRARIAASPEDKRKLEAILHPMIAEESDRRFAAITGRASPGGIVGVNYAVYEAALLVEAGRAGDFAGLIYVDAGTDARLARLIARDGMAPDAARQFLGAQGPEDAKRTAATHRLSNDGTLDELRAKVRLLHSSLTRREKTFIA
ncbi:MAG: dephospho-CoA kinase [Bdellovibrionales bacterium]|nr:dephospho-CoA kinase [Bdellovibrionales bacterium]